MPTTDEQVVPTRHRLPDERRAYTHRFGIMGHEVYVTVGLYDDGTPGEIFIVMAKEGSTISGITDAFAKMVSLGLQYGIPLQVLIDEFINTRFEPSGGTSSREIPMAKSVVDYIFRWLQKFQRPTDDAGINDVVPCHMCGSNMIKKNSVFSCPNCGDTIPGNR